MGNIHSNSLPKKAMETFSLKSSKNFFTLNNVLESFEKSKFIYCEKINWHGVQINLYLQSEKFIKQVNNYFPTEWFVSNQPKKNINIYLFDDELNNIDPSLWEDTDPDCHLYQHGKAEWACQRDFIAKKENDTVVAICKNSISDGFFNLMRWVLPRYWLTENHFLFHSSCVLNSKGEAYLCLGPSGAGKTTISKFLPKNQVLGDDMNLLSLDSTGKAWLTPSLLGQRYESNELFGKKFPLKQIFWLEKSKINCIDESSDISLRLKTCLSLVNIFWKHLSPMQLISIQSLIYGLNKKYNIKKLQFSLDEGVWDYVFSKK